MFLHFAPPSFSIVFQYGPPPSLHAFPLIARRPTAIAHKHPQTHRLTPPPPFLSPSTLIITNHQAPPSTVAADTPPGRRRARVRTAPAVVAAVRPCAAGLRTGSRGGPPRRRPVVVVVDDGCCGGGWACVGRGCRGAGSGRGEKREEEGFHGCEVCVGSAHLVVE